MAGRPPPARASAHPLAPLGGLVKRSFSLAGHRTSVALEAEFWAALEGMAGVEGRTLSALVAAVDAVRAPGRPLASALRVHALGRGSTAPDG